MLSLLSARRRRRLAILAAHERARQAHRYLALILVFLYNMAGFADILSTQYAIYSGAGYEANPVIRSAMEGLSWHNGWIAIKLTLQFMVSAMVIWFPHKIVMALFGFVVTIMGSVVVNNLMIGGLL